VLWDQQRVGHHLDDDKRRQLQGPGAEKLVLQGAAAISARSRSFQHSQQAAGEVYCSFMDQTSVQVESLVWSQTRWEETKSSRKTTTCTTVEDDAAAAQSVFRIVLFFCMSAISSTFECTTPAIT
jgi:hypothetical protein